MAAKAKNKAAPKQAGSKPAGAKKTTAKKAAPKQAAKRAAAQKPAAKTVAAKSPKPPKSARPASVAAYLDLLPPDRREAVEAVRKEINRRLPKGYEEGIQYGMIGWYVPHSLYPAGYHCDTSQPLPFVGVASQKNHLSIYLMCIYGAETHRAWFEKEWKKSGKKLDMGKSCVRFKRLEQIPLPLIGEAVARVPVKDYIAHYEGALRGMSKRK